jgi:hypothetical protein
MKKTINYGIIREADLPADSYTEDILYNHSPINIYGVTSDFSSLPGVSNHCAATSAANMMMYYATHHSDAELIKNENLKDTFISVHGYIKNGPVAANSYRNRLSDYVSHETGYIPHTALLHTWTEIKNHIASGHMLYLLVWQGLSAHFINGVGYREYSSESKYIRIHDNWNNNINHYINYTVASSWPNTLGYFYVSLA